MDFKKYFGNKKALINGFTPPIIIFITNTYILPLIESKPISNRYIVTNATLWFLLGVIYTIILVNREAKKN